MKVISFCIDLIEDTNKNLRELTNKFLDVVMVIIFFSIIYQLLVIR